MNIAIYAYGRAGGRIAHQFKRMERWTMDHITEQIVVVDTAQRPLNQLDKIDEDNRLLIGHNRLEGRGTGHDIEEGVTVAKQTNNYVVNTASDLSRYDIDAFLVIGSLGGGTGSGGAPVIARSLSNIFDKTPVYGVGVVPSVHDPPVCKYNASRAIQTFARETHNLLLFDNDQMDVFEPKDKEPDEWDEVFEDANETIARCLHLLFTADERKTPSHLSGATPTKDDIINALNTGGISTVGYKAEILPRSARPGVTGMISGAAASLAKAIKSPENPNNTVEIPHPVDMVDDSVGEDALMLECDALQAEKIMFNLIAPKGYLSREDVNDVSDWAEEVTNAAENRVAAYPMKSKRTGVLAVYSAIPTMSKKIERIQRRGSELASKYEQRKIEEEFPKKRDVFNESPYDVPPAF